MELYKKLIMLTTSVFSISSITYGMETEEIVALNEQQETILIAPDGGSGGNGGNGGNSGNGGKSGG